MEFQHDSDDDHDLNERAFYGNDNSSTTQQQSHARLVSARTREVGLFIKLIQESFK